VPAPLDGWPEEGALTVESREPEGVDLDGREVLSQQNPP
jgi:hypothetical protein